MAPIVYFLGGVLVRATTKAIRDRLIAQGFRKATKGQIDSKIPTVTGTENNLISLITRAKNAIKSESPVASSGRNTPRRTNKLGGSGQSAAGRKLGSMRMKNYGKVRGGKGRAEAMAKPPTTGGSKPAPVNKPVAAAKPGPTAKANQQPRLSSGSTSRTVVRIKPKPKTSSGSKIVSATPTIAGLVAAGALGKVAYDAYIKKYNPTVTQIKAAEKKIKATAKDNRRQPSKEGSLVGDAGTESKRQKAKRILEFTEAKKLENKKRKAAELTAAKADAVKRDTPDRKMRIDRTVRLAAVGGGAGLKKIREDADKKALTEVLNKKIASRKSTEAKEKTKARAGKYTSLASAKKAGSLYYMHKGKELRAAITAEETESASKRIRGEAMKKIAEGK